MVGLKEKMKKDARNYSALQSKIENNDRRKADIYSVAATIYEEAKGLDDKGKTRVAETIRNRYNYYSKNTVNGARISYRDIVAAPGQYHGFSVHQNKKVTDFKKFENDLSPEQRQEWNRCVAIAQKMVDGRLNTDYAKGALGFNKASVAANKRNFNTDDVFKDDSCFLDSSRGHSPHVFFGSYHLAPLKDANGKVLAKGGNPNPSKNTLVQVRANQTRNQGATL